MQHLVIVATIAVFATLAVQGDKSVTTVMPDGGKLGQIFEAHSVQHFAQKTNIVEVLESRTITPQQLYDEFKTAAETYLAGPHFNESWFYHELSGIRPAFAEIAGRDPEFARQYSALAD